MPSGQYIIDGVCNDTDGSTVLSGVTVSCYNATRNQEQLTTTNSLGQYLFNLGNFSKGFSDADEISMFVSRGRDYKEYTTTVNLSNIGETINLTLASTYSTSVLYCTVDEVRKYSGIHSTSEWSNDAIHRIIVQVTRDIDNKTGRTWKGIQTVTNELYDGNDSDTLDLNHNDLVSLTSLSIDDDRDGTFTTMTISSGGVTYVHLYPEGYITIDTAKSVEVPIFRSGPRNVKVSYTYGIAAPTEEVRRLAVLMVSNSINPNPVRQREITDLIKNLQWYRWLNR